MSVCIYKILIIYVLIYLYVRSVVYMLTILTLSYYPFVDIQKCADVQSARSEGMSARSQSGQVLRRPAAADRPYPIFSAAQSVPRSRGPNW